MGKKIRPLGTITNDLEPLILEMVVAHRMQYHEILGIIYQYLSVHCPEAREVYLDDTSPEFYYGPTRDNE